MTIYEQKEIGLLVNQGGTPERQVFSGLSLSRRQTEEEIYDCTMLFNCYVEEAFQITGMQTPVKRQHALQSTINGLQEFITATVQDQLYAYTCLKADLDRMAGGI